MSIARRNAIERALHRQLGKLVWDRTAIAWPNTTFVPANGKPYLAPTLSSIERFQLGIGPDGYAQWRGTYTVAVRVPRNTGTDLATTTAGALALLFPRALSLPLEDGGSLAVQFSSAPTMIPFGDWMSLPFLATWFSNEC